MIADAEIRRNKKRSSVLYVPGDGTKVVLVLENCQQVNPVLTHRAD